MNLHKKLSEKYGWYDAWHKRSGYSKYNWLILASFSILVMLVFVFNYYSWNAENERLQANLAPVKINLSSGEIVGSAHDHILVQFHGGINSDEKNKTLKRQDLKVRSVVKGTEVSIVTLTDPNDTPEKAVQRLTTEEKNNVDFAEVDAAVAPSYIPNDPDYPLQWHHTKMDSPVAWDSVNGAGITIAVADTGVDANHPDLAVNLVPGWNFYDNNNDTSDVMGHGTEVAGAEAAVTDNGNQIAGEAYGAKIMPLRVSDPNGNGYYSTIANAITYAADNGVKVVNVSYEVCGSQTIESAARYLARKGGITVAAAGNSGAFTGCKNSRYIITVSATDAYDLKAGWSNYGNNVDVASPGQAILTTTRGGGEDYYSGTSFSAPLTAGVLALIWSVNPSFTNDQVQKILFNSAVDLGDPGWDQFYGWGRIDAGAAVNLAKVQ